MQAYLTKQYDLILFFLYRKDEWDEEESKRVLKMLEDSVSCHNHVIYTVNFSILTPITSPICTPYYIHFIMGNPLAVPLCQVSVNLKAIFGAFDWPKGNPGVED